MSALLPITDVPGYFVWSGTEAKDDAIAESLIGACYGIAWGVAKIARSEADELDRDWPTHGDVPAVSQMNVTEHSGVTSR